MKNKISIIKSLLSHLSPLAPVGERGWGIGALLLLASVLPAKAQLFHQLGFTANGGWATTASSADVVSAGRGYNTALGFNYEMQYAHLLFDTGVGFQWRSSGVSVKDDSFLYPDVQLVDEDGNVIGVQKLTDTQGDLFQMNVITTQRTDYSRVGELQIPALVGGLYGNFYFLGGLKMCVPLFGVTRTKAHLTTQGIYDRYLLPVTAMDNHAFRTDVESSLRGPKLKTTPVDLKASFEIGYSMSSTDDFVRESERTVREWRLRIALYCDYSLLNMHTNMAGVPVMVSEQMPYDFSQYQFTHILNTDRALNTYMANVNLGVKFTFLIGNKQRFICHNCESAVEAGINSPNSGYKAKGNRQADSTHRPSQVNNPKGAPKE